jgi:transposase
VIIISRLRWHAPTQAYMARRLAEGRTDKMVIRCLKRHVAREVFRAIITDLRLQPDHHRPPRIAA